MDNNKIDDSMGMKVLNYLKELQSSVSNNNEILKIICLKSTLLCELHTTKRSKQRKLASQKWRTNNPEKVKESSRNHYNKAKIYKQEFDYITQQLIKERDILFHQMKN